MEISRTQLRSEEIQEILGKPPKSIVRWGITVISFIIIILLGLCCFVQYPETITADIVIRKNNNKINGIMTFPPNGAGKIEAGQEVLIKLYNYPYLEYGHITTTINEETMYLDVYSRGDAKYSLDVNFPDTIYTSTGYEIIPNIELLGTANIIICNTRLIDKLLKPINAVFQ